MSLDFWDRFEKLFMAAWDQGTGEERRQLLEVARGEHVPTAAELDECPARDRRGFRITKFIRGQKFCTALFAQTKGRKIA